MVAIWNSRPIAVRPRVTTSLAAPSRTLRSRAPSPSPNAVNSRWNSGLAVRSMPNGSRDSRSESSCSMMAGTLLTSSPSWATNSGTISAMKPRETRMPSTNTSAVAATRRMPRLASHCTAGSIANDRNSDTASMTSTVRSAWMMFRAA
jgi:hypothetical protein